ncbi:MRC1-like domain-containing protein [Lineolata rhizophorae]|uniref:MRC1-like domain-containing protein n=1 Tax=Lineolata rhizophorae TaxID=578093 RepID=A0A6A6P413_9PEZI|nr:MRC1-like domain-containing protein [Lineolata rhizophorae]
MQSSPTPKAASPASAWSQSPAMLTPTSKIRRMLAAFDDSDDAASPARPVTKPATKEMPPPDTSSDDDIVRPRGRMAARMLASEEPKEGAPSTPTSGQRSPGLFVSPAERTESSPKRKNARFLELVARKRKEQDERSRLPEESGDDDDSRLTQQARPTRKASKKVLEEMNRETQRMSRSMQLAHEAKTRKKVFVDDLFARFNFRQGGKTETGLPAPARGSDTSPVSAQATTSGADTPLTSPPAQPAETDEELPDIQELMSQKPPEEEKGKGKAVDRPPQQIVAAESDDDDLEIIKPTPSRFAAFDVQRKQSSEPHSLTTLRALAHLRSPSKAARKPGSMTPAELDFALRRQARQQARQEREEKLEQLRARGIHVQTDEERLKDQLEIENMVEQAREEARRLAEKEKAASKEGEGEELHFLDSDEDESYQGSDEEDGDEDVQYSGSEDGDPDGIFDEKADEEGSSEDGAKVGSPIPDDEPLRQSRHRRVIDEDDEDDAASDPMAAFGFQPANDSLDMSQMFAGTLESPAHAKDPSSFPMPVEPALPSPGLDTLVRDSQVPADDVNVSFTQAFAETQVSDIAEPTQDVGFTVMSPLERAHPPSTADTVETQLVPVPESPPRRHRQRRNAFDALRKAKRETLVDAKGMFEEQAEESEDEYAGLGGASDDSDGELDEEVARMIDESDVKVDERKIAAFHADKERADDEKRIDKLYRDIKSGALRRKRGAGFDLSDSDDDAAERRRRKQLEFARMRKALLEDENIGKIANNPKRSAFLRAIEDRDSDDDVGFEEAIPDSQEGQGSQKENVDPRKSKSNTADASEKRPPAHLRRTAADASVRKPVSIAEIRESLSVLIDDPASIPESQYSDHGDSDAETCQGKDHRPSGVVDRLSLMRASASANAGSGPMAFPAPARSAAKPGFRVPNLVRRVTSSLGVGGVTSNSSSGNATPTAGVDAGAVRRGGNKKSNIHYQAREAERKRVVQATEQRKRESARRNASAGARRSVLGVLGRSGSGFD